MSLSQICLASQNMIKCVASILIIRIDLNLSVYLSKDLLLNVSTLLDSSIFMKLIDTG